MKLMSRHRLVSRKVATWFWVLRPSLGLGRRNGVATLFRSRDLDWPEWCHDTDLMSRHGSGWPMEIGVVTPFLRSRPRWFWFGRREVATCPTT